MLDNVRNIESTKVHCNRAVNGMITACTVAQNAQMEYSEVVPNHFCACNFLRYHIFCTSFITKTFALKWIWSSPIIFEKNPSRIDVIPANNYGLFWFGDANLVYFSCYFSFLG